MILHWHLIDQGGSKFVTRLKSHTKPSFVRELGCNDHEIRLSKRGRRAP